MSDLRKGLKSEPYNIARYCLIMKAPEEVIILSQKMLMPLKIYVKVKKHM